MRILIRTSNWAIWARRWASFALPLLVIPVIMHRLGLLLTPTFQFIEIVAAGIAILALVMSLGALVRLWQTGDRGWDRAIFGLLLSLFCLAPFAYGAVLLLHNPEITDVSTDLADPPALSETQKQPTTPAPTTIVDAAFPNAQTRNYPVGVRQVFTMVGKLVDDRGWAVGITLAPETIATPGQINAVDTTLLGWRDEVSLRVAEAADGSTVDMRSASLDGGSADFGNNGRRVEDFLVALDNAVTQLLRENPNGIEDPEDEPRPTVDPITGAPIPADRPPGL